jgi:hypothetical protein
MLSSTPSPAAAVFSVFDKLARKRGRECPRCGGRHKDPQFKMCGPCRDITAAYHKAYRYDHIARKLCTECVNKKDKKRFRKCEHHHLYHNAYQVEYHAKKRAAGLCAWGACKISSDMYFCDAHMEKRRASMAARQNRPRNRRWAA